MRRVHHVGRWSLSVCKTGPWFLTMLHVFLVFYRHNFILYDNPIVRQLFWRHTAVINFEGFNIAMIIENLLVKILRDFLLKLWWNRKLNVRWNWYQFYLRQHPCILLLSKTSYNCTYMYFILTKYFQISRTIDIFISF